MITRSQPNVQIIGSDAVMDKSSSSWQKQLKEALRTPEALCRFVKLEEHVWPLQAQAGHELFPIRVPLAYARRIRPGDPNDPLLRQVLPLQQETLPMPGYVTDPLAEAIHSPAPGLIHKYSNRILLIASGGCAINCRYCFRRHFPYQENVAAKNEWSEALDYLCQHPAVNEVILSGGDPLLNPDLRLAALLERLEQIPHLIRLRIHTRLPVVIPDRITAALCDRLAGSSLQCVVVLHINHPAEIDASVTHAVDRLRRARVTVLNQSVLLRGVNDDVDTLALLSEKLFAAGILPYYLHVLDPVAGAAHFDVPDQEAIALVEDLRTRLAGFLLPKLVREIPGRPSKTPL